MAARKRSSPNRQAAGANGASNSPMHSPARAAAQSPKDANGDSDALAMLALAQLVTQRAHLLVPGAGDQQLAQQAQLAVKASFDKALANEAVAYPTLRSLFASINQASAPSTRSHAAKDAHTSALRDERAPALDPTPLEELTTEGMDPDMVWEQMEMKGRAVSDLLETMFGGEEEEDEDEDSDEEDSEDEAEEDDIDMDAIDWDGQREDDGDGMLGQEEDDSDDDDGLEEDFEEQEPHYRPLENHSDDLDPEEDEEDDEADELPKKKRRKTLSLDNFDDAPSRKPSTRSGPLSEVDDDFFSLQDFHRQTDAGEFEMAKMIRGEADEGGDESIDLFGPVGGAEDDDEEEEEGDDEDEDEDEDLDAAGVTYADFFAPPPRSGPKKTQDQSKAKGKGKATGKSTREDAVSPKPPSANDEIGTQVNGKTKRGVRFADAVKVKLIAPRKKRSSEDDSEDDEDFEEDDLPLGMDMEEAELDGLDEDEDTEDNEEDEEDDGDDSEEGSGGEDDEDESVSDQEEQGTINRFRDSLFDDDDEDNKKDANLSKHERRLMALSSQIAALEAENVSEKYWATRGEAKSRDRPVNSLLEEDLEFERMGKVVPIVTEETTKSIEDLIKRRILESNFDDVVRKRPVEPNAFLPSRFMELQDTKSNKSLAEIYEDEYKDSRAKDEGRAVTHKVDEELEEKHREIEELFEDLASKLDALSNARFTPKPPKAEISTVSNLPSISIESALPTATSASTMLAPEEVYTPNAADQDRSDLTPAQKRAERQKRRKQRALMHKKAEKFSQGVKGEKERAVKQLVGTKGVTVLGKGGEKVQGKKRRRDEDGSAGSSSVGLKL